MQEWKSLILYVIFCWQRTFWLFPMRSFSPYLLSTDWYTINLASLHIAHITLFTVALTNSVSLPIRKAKRKRNDNNPLLWEWEDKLSHTLPGMHKWLGRIRTFWEWNLAIYVKRRMKYMHIFLDPQILFYHNRIIREDTMCIEFFKIMKIRNNENVQQQEAG